MSRWMSRATKIFTVSSMALVFSAFGMAQDVSLAPATVPWAAVQIGQTSGAKTVTVTNNQSSPLTISSIAVTGDFAQTASTCALAPATLAGGASCTISVHFQPLAQGPTSGAITLSDDAPSSTQSAALSGTGVVGPVLFSPTSLSFPNAVVGSTSPAQSVTLTNEQTSPLALSNIRIFGLFAQTNNCPTTLDAGGSCSLSVTFQPHSSGASVGGVIATYGSGNTTNQLYLSGSTSVAAAVALTPSTFNFGSAAVPSGSPQQLYPTQAFTLTNNSTSPLTIASVATNSTDYTIASNNNNCPASPATLAPNTSCTVTVTFIPTTTGARPGTLTVDHDAPGSPATASLMGTGTGGSPSGGVFFSPSSLSWGAVQVGQTSGAKSFTLTNDQSSALTISSIAVSSDFVETATTCPLAPSTLAASASCTVSVEFRPLASGARTGSVTFTDDGSGSPQSFPLSGTATVGAILFSPTSLTFASVPDGTVSPSQTAKLTNEQSTDLTITKISTWGQFAQTNDCPVSPSTLAAHASCTLTVTSNPTVNGNTTGGVNVTYSSGSLALALSGAGTSGGGGGGGGTGVTFSPTTYSFPNQAVGTTSAPVAVALTNGQSVALSVSSVQISAPFSETDGCVGTVPAGKSCTIMLTYSPAAPAYSTASLTVTDNASNSPQIMTVHGNSPSGSGGGGGTGVTVVPAAGGLYFSVQLVGRTSSPQPITVTNNQSTAVTMKSINTAGDYTTSNTCIPSGSSSGNLAPGARCTIEVSFDPQAAGSRPGSVTLSYTASGSPYVVPLQGTGEAGGGGVGAITPQFACGLPSHSIQFTATTRAVNWYVDNVSGGNSTVGTISSSGLYTAPTAAGTHTIKAVSQANNATVATTTFTVSTSPSFAIYPFTASIAVSTQQSFQGQVCTVPVANATYTVDNIAGGNATVGTITSAGLYTAPGGAGTHTIRATDASLNKTSAAVATVYSNIAVDFGSRTNTSHPIPTGFLGAERVDSLHNASDIALIADAGMMHTRTYSQIAQVYATTTPNWSLIDRQMDALHQAGIHPLLQMWQTPPWLQPSSNPCGKGNNLVAPTDVNQWGKLAASYVAHMDAKYPGFVQDYEIWNEPNVGGLCQHNVNTYLSIYAAAAPLMKKQAAADGETIRIGGPATAGIDSAWISALLSNASTAPYVDFVSYHLYEDLSSMLAAKWDTYNGYEPLYQRMQDPSIGPAGYYKKVLALVAAGKQPLGARTPIYTDEFNTNPAFSQDCCRNDPTYAPLFNALFVADVLNTVYSGAPDVPGKLTYYATTAYPYFCLVGTLDSYRDCQYSEGSTPVPYPQYYAFQIISSSNYLGLQQGGDMATSVSPPAGIGGVAVTAFYTASNDAVLIVNPTATAFPQMKVNLENTGYSSPQATLFQIVNGDSITRSSLALTQSGSTFSATVDIPAYTVMAISMR